MEQVYPKRNNAIAIIILTAFVPESFNKYRCGRSSDLLQVNRLPVKNSGNVINLVVEITASGNVTEFHRIPY